MGTLTKGLIGEQDFSRWLGNSAKTFNRPTSTGGEITLNKIGVEVDALISFGSGSAYTWDTLNSAIGSISTNQCVLILRPGTWTVTDDLTIPSTMVLRCPKGVSLSVSSGKTLTISGKVDAGPYQIFSGAGTVTMNTARDTMPEWWGSTQVRAITGACTLNSYDKVITADGTFTISLTSAATLGQGARYQIINIGSGTITIDPAGAETINGNATVSQTSQFDYLEIVSDGTNWLRPQQTVVEQAKTGFAVGLNVQSKDDDEITVSSGAIEIDGVIYYLAADTDKQVTSLSASTWYYVYVDPPATGTTLGATDIEYSTTAPVWTEAKNGWYHPTNTDWRALIKSGGVFKASAGSTVRAFSCRNGIWSFQDPQVYFLSTGSPSGSLTAIAVGAPALDRLLVHIQTEIYGGTAPVAMCYWSGDHDATDDVQQLVVTQEINSSHIYGQGWLLTDTSQRIIYKASAGCNTDNLLLGFVMPE
jgi:hypothetical protein